MTRALQKMMFALLFIFCLFWNGSVYGQENTAVTSRLEMKYDKVEYDTYRDVTYDNPRTNFWVKHGYYIVTKDSLYGVCDAQGNEILPLQAHHIWHMEGPSLFCYYDGLHQFGILDKKGRPLFSEGYDYINPAWFEKYGYVGFYVKRGRKDGFLGMDGEVVLPIEYEKVVPRPNENKFEVKKNGVEYTIPYDFPINKYMTYWGVSGNECLHEGYYFFGSDGYSSTYGKTCYNCGFCAKMYVKIYRDYIYLGDTKCEFTSEQGSERKYKYGGLKAAFSGFDSDDYLYVNFNNYNIRHVQVSSTYVMGSWQYSTTTFPVTKVSADYVPNQTNRTNSTNYPTNTTTNNASTQTTTTTTTTPSPSSSYRDCTYCRGTGKCPSGYSGSMSLSCGNSGKCRPCLGTGYVDGRQCTSCRGSGNCNWCYGTGKCPHCNGSGKVQ